MALQRTGPPILSRSLALNLASQQQMACFGRPKQRFDLRSIFACRVDLEPKWKRHLQTHAPADRSKYRKELLNTYTYRTTPHHFFIIVPRVTLLVIYITPIRIPHAAFHARGSNIMPCYVCDEWALAGAPPWAMPVVVPQFHGPLVVPCWIWCNRFERDWGEGWICLCCLVCYRKWEQRRGGAAGG